MTSPRETLDDESTEASPRTSRYVLAVGLVLLLCGLLFGYDQGVISGALNGIQKDFDPSTLVIEIITSWVTLGAMVGALVAGVMADRLGRRPTLILSAVIFVVGALAEALAPNTTVLVIARLVLGAGVGIASVAGPLYGAENAAARDRGRMVSMYQLAITIGIFLAYWADYLLIESDNWRLMLGISAVPAVLLVLAILPLRDSATWYMKGGRREEAEAVVRKAEPDVDATARVNDIETLLATEVQASWSEVFAATWRKPLIIAGTLAVLAAAHRHQRRHLLRGHDLRRCWVRLAEQREPGDAVGDRCRQRPRNLCRGDVGRPLRPQAAAADRLVGDVLESRRRRRRVPQARRGHPFRPGVQRYE